MGGEEGLARHSRRRCLGAGISLALLSAWSPVLWAQAQAQAATAQEGAVAPLKIAPLAFERRILANGLELIALPQAGATVSVQLWYRVGGKDDPAGRSGFAHLFEHMMFKRTRYMANEQFDRMTEDVGGSNNAFTADDMTAYHSVVPANHLEPLLWAEAERMVQSDRGPGQFRQRARRGQGRVPPARAGRALRPPVQCRAAPGLSCSIPTAAR